MQQLLACQASRHAAHTETGFGQVGAKTMQGRGLSTEVGREQGRRTVWVGERRVYEVESELDKRLPSGLCGGAGRE